MGVNDLGGGGARLIFQNDSLCHSATGARSGNAFAQPEKPFGARTPKYLQQKRFAAGQV